MLDIKTITLKAKNTWFNKFMKPWLSQRKAGTLYTDEIENRKIKERKKYPLRHFLFTDVPYVLCDVTQTFHMSYYMVLVDYIRLRTWDRYHVIKLGKPDYYSHSGQMLFASFEILKDFVETNLKDQLGIFSYLDMEYLLNDKDSNTGPDMVTFIKKQNVIAHKIIDLYVWWTTVKPYQEASNDVTQYMYLPKDFDNLRMFKSPESQKSTGYYYLEQHLDKLLTEDDSVDDVYLECEKKLIELYSLWYSISD